jgi:hypothetical protein
MNLTVRFKDFWVGFQENENIFLDILVDRGYRVAIESDDKAKVDLEVVSVFPPYPNVVDRLASKVNKRLPHMFKQFLNERSNKLEGLRNSLCTRRKQNHLKIGPDARNGAPQNKACVDLLV